MSVRAVTLVLTLSALTAACPAQPAVAPSSAAPLTAQQDHQRLMDLLHIAALRPGVSQSGTGDHPVNWDESKANPWPKLPDPLVFNNGKPVKTAADWTSKRRAELVEIFDREIVGRVPANVPGVTWRVASTEAVPATPDAPATIVKHLVGHVDNSAYPAVSVDIDLDLVTPAPATPASAKASVPIVMEITFDKYPRPANRPQAPAPPEPHPTWREQVLARGWGYAIFYPTTVQPDNGAGLAQGIIGLTAKGQPRKLDDWGALRAWAWGASRAMDYFATDPAVDARHVAVAGHSRFGKAALVTMAYDPRFAVAYVSSSGAGGADLARRRFGEQLENIASSGEYHWMAGNYIRYAALTPKEITPNDMPVDMHELIALCAPRPILIGGGTKDGGDGWADTAGTFYAALGAAPVYRLLGLKALTGADGTPATALPPVSTALTSGALAFRQHPLGHTPLRNFPTFLDFAARYMLSKPAPMPVATTEAKPDGNGVYRVGGSVSAPILIHTIEPDMPSYASGGGPGLCDSPLLNFVVGIDGIPTNVKLVHVRTDDAHSGLTEAIQTCKAALISAVSQYRFKPAMDQGHPVPAQLNLEINIAYLGPDPTPNRTSPSPSASTQSIQPDLPVP